MNTNNQTNNQTKLIKLDDLTTLHITGNDATRFLHAQFTNDLENLPVDSWQYRSYCTPKGRLLAFMTIARLQDKEYLLFLPKKVSENILPRLRMFVMRDDVTITPQQESSVITGLLGSASIFASAGLDVENETGKLSNKGNHCTLTLDAESGRYLCISEQDSLNTSPFETASRDDWTLFDIQAGIPAILSETQEAYVPQMVNLDLIGAVNFKKGCYPGQEIVARVHYLGKIKQRMYVLTTESMEMAKPADNIFINGMPDKPAGTIVQAAKNESSQLLQAVLQTKAVDENADFRLATEDGEKITLATQPYSVADEKEK
jgi:folate-binding protein YgfZ